MALSSLPITSLFASPSLFRRIPKCDVSKGTAWYHGALPGKVAIAAWSTRQSPGWLVRQMLDASEGQYPFWKISMWLQSVSKCSICHHILPKMKITWDYQTDIRSAFFSRKFAPLPCQIAFWDAWKLQTFGVSKVQNLSRSAPVGLNPCDTDWYPTQKWWSCMTFLMSIIISFQKWWNREVEEQHCRWIIWMKLYIQRGVELAVDASYQRFISMTHLLFQCMISARLQGKDQIELEFPMPNSSESWRLLGRWYWSLAGLRAVGTKLSDSGSIVEGS